MSESWSRQDRARILLVDDEDLIRNPLYTLLENEGYEVFTASNGADGITIFRQEGVKRIV
ncbi:MAG TPA: hypothetical protein VIL63_04380 [Terriglobales bacterium]